MLASVTTIQPPGTLYFGHLAPGCGTPGAGARGGTGGGAGGGGGGGAAAPSPAPDPAAATAGAGGGGTSSPANGSEKTTDDGTRTIERRNLV